MSTGKGIKYFTCTLCQKPKARIYRRAKRHICATCMRRIRTSAIVQGGA